MKETLFASGILMIFVLCETLHRRADLPKEYARKATHILSGLWTMVSVWHIELSSIAWIAGGYFILLLALQLQKHPLLKAISTADRSTVGTIAMPLGIATVASLWTNHQIFLIAIATLTLADPIAGLMKHAGHKRMVASTAFFIITTAIMYMMNSRDLDGALGSEPMLVALLITFIEARSPRGTDNFFVPVGTAFLLWLPL